MCSGQTIINNRIIWKIDHAPHTDPLKFQTFKTMKTIHLCDGKNVRFLFYYNRDGWSAHVVSIGCFFSFLLFFFIYWNWCRFLTLLYLFLNSIHSLNITYSSFFASYWISIVFFVLLNAHCFYSRTYSFDCPNRKRKPFWVICAFSSVFLFDIYLDSRLWAK